MYSCASLQSLPWICEIGGGTATGSRQLGLKRPLLPFRAHRCMPLNGFGRRSEHASRGRDRLGNLSQCRWLARREAGL